MAEYNPAELDKKWQAYWKTNHTFAKPEVSEKPKFYILDMFPYPSGTGLHVGHPLGYIATDIVARHKRQKGYNVLHPMGFDAFGLPAEQYAIETGQHPATTTAQNIAKYIGQLDRVGLAYDWESQVQTCEPEYYKYTQQIFIELFNHYYDEALDKALPISTLEAHFASYGSEGIRATCTEAQQAFGASDWLEMEEQAKSGVLLNYRLAFLSEAFVNWCPALGSVLANDEVKDGYSIRGSHPVERKKMRQWMLRITAYAHRLLTGLDELQWPEAVKEMQRNWIGFSHGAELDFIIQGHDLAIKVFTTRVDTIYGVSCLVLAPEHELVHKLTTLEHKAEVEDYIAATAARSELDRKADVKRVSGAFTGSYVLHPFSGDLVPIWIADYVLAGYGTGAVMGVPSSDTRDYAFAQHFNLPILPILEGPNTDIAAEDFDPKAGTLCNSDFLDGLDVPTGIEKALEAIEAKKLGTRKVQYRMRDAVFGRQRYWGEPIPIYYEHEIPKVLPLSELPLVLPSIDAFKPTETGEPPLARAEHWEYKGCPLETTTMPGWAGSSWYFLRYPDPHNAFAMADVSLLEYWNEVDLYVGGAEHATGHLLYSRFWTKFLFDIGKISFQEPFRRMVNQGMIQGRSSIAYKLKDRNTFVSAELKGEYDVVPTHVDVSLVEDDVLDRTKFAAWRPDLANAEFIVGQAGLFRCDSQVEKMSKSLYNVVNPDVVVDKYGADTLRLYEMFLGPLELSKPWSMQGIEGVSKFLRRFYKQFFDGHGKFALSADAPMVAELKVLHRTLQKVADDIERLQFNTAVSTFMICLNGLQDLKCTKRSVLEPLLIAISPFAPHLAEELWSQAGHADSIANASYPAVLPQYLEDDTALYPVSINGKTRVKLDLPKELSIHQVQEEVMANADVLRYLEGKEPKKVIVVLHKIVNIVV